MPDQPTDDANFKEVILFLATGVASSTTLTAVRGLLARTEAAEAERDQWKRYAADAELTATMRTEQRDALRAELAAVQGMYATSEKCRELLLKGMESQAELTDGLKQRSRTAEKELAAAHAAGVAEQRGRDLQAIYLQATICNQKGWLLTESLLRESAAAIERSGEEANRCRVAPV